MNAPLRKGWCPGALRPMAARDGLLVRLRITGGILSAERAAAIADIATRHGSGQIDLSARGNLQLRGVTEGALSDIWRELTSLGLLDADPAAEAIRNVLASPLAGCGHRPDIRPMVVALEAGLTACAELHALPAKTLFLVDDGGAPSLAGVSADVRFDRIAESEEFAIGLGGTAGDALPIGSCGAAAVPERARAIAHGIVALRRRHREARRVRDILAIAGAETLATACGGTVRRATHRGTPACRPQDVVGARRIDGIAVVGLAAPFGRLTARMLAGAAAFAARTQRSELRMTPWRVFLVPDAATPSRLDGFITDATDPRLAIAACVGQAGCAQGTTSTQEDATQFAKMLAPTLRDDVILHVAGCAKGCARPQTTRVTLVGREGRYDLVREGRAPDAPHARGLDLGDIRRLFATDPP